MKSPDKYSAKKLTAPTLSLACARCESTGAVKLEALSAETRVDYFRCHTCGHVWTVSRDAAHSVRDVTLPLEADRDS